MENILQQRDTSDYVMTIRQAIDLVRRNLEIRYCEKEDSILNGLYEKMANGQEYVVLF